MDYLGRLKEIEIMFGYFKYREREQVLRLEYDRKLSEFSITNQEHRAKEKREHADKLAEVKRECEEKLIRFKTEYESKVAELKTKHSKEFNEFKAQSAKEYYAQLQKEFTELQKDGDKNSKFVQELALKMMEKNPPVRNELTYKNVR